MTSRLKSSKPKQLLPLAVALTVVIAAAFVVITNHAGQPSIFVRLAPDIDHATCNSGEWYWVKHVDDTHDVLERATGAGVVSGVSYAGEIGAYAVGSDHLFVLSRNEKSWRATVSNMDGAQSRDVWAGSEQPHGALISGDSAYWLRSKPAAAPEASAYPPLSSQIELISTSITSGESRVLSTIMEPEGIDVIGVHEGDIWISAHRSSVHGVSTVYRVPSLGGYAQRIIGETGNVSALLTSEGILYWTAPSIEAQNFDQIWCVCKRDAAGKVTTLTDWLPSGGRLFSTQHGICYVDGNAAPLAWPVTTHAELPRPVPIAAGYYVVAAGYKDLLLRTTHSSGSIYRMWPK